MKWIYELAAALFFAAAGYLAAGAAPDKTVGAVVGICLLLVGAVLLAAGLQGLLKKWQECRAAEQEQAEKHAAELKGTMDALQAKLQTLCESTAAVQTVLTEERDAAASYYKAQLEQEKNEHAALLEKLEKLEDHGKKQNEAAAAIYTVCSNQQKNINTLCQSTQTAVGAVKDALEDSAGRQEKAIGNLCKDMQTCLNNACDHAGKQQTALTEALQQVNEDNRTKLDQILQNYAQLTAQDVEVLKALGLGVEENDD